MKKTTKLKALVLSLAMAVLALLPTTTNAQSDGFFRGGEDYENRNAGINSNDGTGIENYGIGEQVPLGSGLLILAAAGAGYAALRRKRNKKGFVMIIALAMIVTMSNCKKKVETINSVAENGVKITLTVDGGSKVIVNPTGGGTFATVTFEKDDVIYVGNNGHYCGYLQHNGDYFTGTINDSDLSTSDYLHFYFMGNKGELSEPTSVNISDQSAEYPVISYAHSRYLYTGEGAYSAKLQNYCAIAKFPLSGTGTTNAVYVRGMKNTVTVDFAANNGAKTGDPYTFSQEGNGTIKLHSESATEKWAIVLEQGAVTADLLADGFEATTVSVPEIERNTYHASDILSTSLTEGSKLCYSFSVDDKGSVVRFSKGNLQAVFEPSSLTTCTWRFAENQYDYVGDAAANTKVDNNQVTQAGTVDLFGWVGEKSSLAAYGINNNNTASSYGNTAKEALKDDWGNVAISNGGNKANSGWRTLTSAEWVWLLDPSSGANPRTNCRTSSTVNNVENARFTKAAITTPSNTTVNGLIIFPDSYSGVTPLGVTWGTINGTSNDYTTTCTAAGWEALEAAGCVFLPAAGSRDGTTVNKVNSLGFYWSSTSNESNADYAYRVRFRPNSFYPLDSHGRNYGLSVRLVF